MQQGGGHVCGGQHPSHFPQQAPAGMMPPAAPMGWRPPQPGFGGGQAAQVPHPVQQFTTEILLCQSDERIRNHREALKVRLQISGGLNLEELEYAIRVMLMSGRFAGGTGIPESMLMPSLPERFVMPPSPFRTIAELAASLPWLLRVHQSMQWVAHMPNGLMTVQRLICPAASEMGQLAAPEGVLSVDWRMVDEVMARPPDTTPVDQLYRPSMAGDPRFPRGAPPVRPGEGALAGQPGVEGQAVGAATNIPTGVEAPEAPVAPAPAPSHNRHNQSRQRKNHNNSNHHHNNNQNQNQHHGAAAQTAESGGK